MKRNPMAAGLSIYRTLFTQNSRAGHSAAIPYAYNLTELGHQFQLYSNLMAHWELHISPKQLLTVEYEDLIANQENVRSCSQATPLIVGCR